MHFVYKSKKPSGEIYSGDREAKDRFEFYKLIREAGEEIISFKEIETTKSHILKFDAIFGQIKTIDKINLAKNMGLMLDSGLPLSRTLMVLEKQSKNAKLKKILNQIMDNINSGSTLADALKKHPKIFPPIFISMVHAGEQSGTLSLSLKSIATQMENSYGLEKRVKGALIYPAVIVTLMVIVAILMFIFVIPTLLKTFTDMKVELPFTTKIVLEISNLIQHQGIFVLLGIIILGSLSYYWSKTKSGRSTIDRLILRLPIVGILVQEVNSARTARTLSSLFKAGVDVIEAMSITNEVVQNVHFRKVIDKATESVKKGDPISRIFADATDLYPIFFAEMVNVGEETGQISGTLEEVAKFYEADVDEKTKNMSTVIEPVLMIVVGAAVGFFAISMISPMYSLVNAI
jgi:type IV pilus assembly protein PilC